MRLWEDTWQEAVFFCSVARWPCGTRPPAPWRTGTPSVPFVGTNVRRLCALEQVHRGPNRAVVRTQRLQHGCRQLFLGREHRRKTPLPPGSGQDAGVPCLVKHGDEQNLDAAVCVAQQRLGHAALLQAQQIGRYLFQGGRIRASAQMTCEGGDLRQITLDGTGAVMPQAHVFQHAKT